MRIAFVQSLFEIAKKDNRVILITADLGYSVFEQFMKELPKQFLNIGISEQNMAGVAAGMAMEGKIPVIYSIVPFSTMRNFEQIRNDICYQNLNVKIVGVGAGFSYGPYGHTHHGLEDIGILRTLANLTIMAPGDPVETNACTEEALRMEGPVYIRLGRAGEPNVHTDKIKKIKSLLDVVSYGNDYLLLATSTMVAGGKEIVELLHKKGLSGAMISVPIIKPFSVKEFMKKARIFPAVFTLEEHAIIGGLGSTVAEVIAESDLSVEFRRFGVPDRFTKVMGDQEYMRRANTLATEQVASEIDKRIGKKNS